MRKRLLAALLAALLMIAATSGLAEDEPEAPAIEREVQEVPSFEVADDPPAAELYESDGEEPETPSEPEEEVPEEPSYEEEPDELPEAEELPGDEVPEDEPGAEDALPEEIEPSPEEPEASPMESDVEEADPLPAVEPERVENIDGVDPRDCQHPVTVAVVNRDARDIDYTDLHNGSHRITGSGVLVVLCADCGMAVDRKNEYVEKCSYDASDESGAICQYCDHVKGDDGRHIHEFTGEYHDFCGALLGASPDPDAPELYHICRFQKLQARKCAQCDTYEDTVAVPGEVIESRENHVWQADGRCALCGCARTCRHEGETLENAWDEDVTYTFVNAAAHEYSAVRYVQRCCAQCGEPLGNVEVSRVNLRQNHRFEDGVCADCGYVNVCSHPNMVYTYAVEPGGAAFAPVDGLNHKVGNLGGVYITEARCPDCGFTLSGLKQAVSDGQSVTLPHRFDRNGVCMDCGYIPQVSQAECSHPEEYRVALDPSDVTALKQSCRYAVDPGASNDASHVLRVEYDPSWTCALCGYHEDLRSQSRFIVVSEPHNFNKGYCVTANCGHRCPHTQVNGQETAGQPFYDYDGAEGHYETVPTIVTGTCVLCGEYVKNHVVETTRGRMEFHTMENGVCTKCGYACPHPDADIVRLLPAEHTAYAVYDDAEHSVSEERVTETICQACGHTLFEEVETLGEYRMPHSFVHGVCALCGYDPLNDTARMDEDDFDDLPADQRLYGVCADDAADIVKASVRVGDSLQPEIDAGTAEAEIENIDRLFKSRELSRLYALPLRDRLLTAQYFLGFVDDVTRAAAIDDTLLSGDAVKLIRDIQARINSMTPDEREAFDQARRAAFPMTPFEVVPGVTTEVFNIDLAVQSEGITTVARYSFQNTGSSWNLINIAVR